MTEKCNGVKTFDELYSEFCSELREQSKSTDLCKRIKSVRSDLKRVQVLLLSCPNLVQNIKAHIQDNFEGKSESGARELLAKARTHTPSESREAIGLLSEALLLSPWRAGARESSEEELEEFSWSSSLDPACVQRLVTTILSVDPASQAASQTGLGTINNDNSNNHNNNSNVPPNSEPVSGDLLSEIYFDRSKRFSQLGDYESGLLDLARAIISSPNPSHKALSRPGALTFTTASNLGLGLRAMGYYPEARSVLLHALQLLRYDPLTDNQSKSIRTVSIIKALKELKAKTDDNDSFSPASTAPTNHQVQLEDKLSSSCKDKEEREQKPSGKKSLSHHPQGLLLPPSNGQEGDTIRAKNNNSNSDGAKSLEDIFGKPSSTLLAASDAIEMKYERERGRHAVATRTIPPGATLIVDSPYSWSLYPQVYKRLCQHCCRKVVSGIPCQHCSSVVFCKWECWARSEHYHKFECRILKGLDSSETLGEMALLCYRTVCKTERSVFAHYISQVESDEAGVGAETDSSGGSSSSCSNSASSNRASGISSSCGSSSSNNSPNNMMPSMANNSERNGLYLGLDEHSHLDPAKLPSILALTTNARDRTAGDIIKRTLVAIYLTLCLRYTGYFSSSNNSSSRSPNGSCNSSSSSDHQQWTHNRKEHQEEQQDLQQQQQQQQPGETLSFKNTPNHNNDNNSGGSSSNDEPPPGVVKDGELSHMELHIAAFMLRLSQSLSCNAYGMNHVVPNNNGHESSSRLMHTIHQFGGACYPTVSITNHSCNPNIFRFTYGNICIVRALQEIKQGEELLDSYGPSFATMDLATRQNLLKTQYFFDCPCKACVENWPLFKDLKASQANTVGLEQIYKCPACGGIKEKGRNDKSSSSASSRKCNNGSGSGTRRKENGKCLNCGQKFDLGKVSEALIESERKYLGEKESLILTGKLNENGERVLTHHLSLLHKFLTSPHKLIVESQETLKLASFISILPSSSSSSSSSSP